MAIQEISNPSERYLVRGWDEDPGDPKVDLEIRPGALNGSLLSVADVVEAVRAYVAAVPAVEEVEVRHVTVSGPSEVVIPAP